MKSVGLFFFLTGLLLSSPLKAVDIFFVHSYHHAYPWVQEYYTAYKHQLKGASLLDYEMDTKRIPSDRFEFQAEQALSQIQQHQPKLVVVADDNALKLVGKPALAQGYPVIFLGINGNPRNLVPLSENLAGVLERPLMRRSIADLSKVVSSVDKVLVLLDDGPTTDAIFQTSLQGNRQQLGKVTLQVERVKTFQSWQKLVRQSQLQGYDLIIIGNYAKLLDQQQRQVPLDITSQWTSKHSPIPVFGFWSYSVGLGKAIGGLVLSGAEQGKKAAEISNTFLQQNHFPKPAISTPKKGQYLFSRSELRRWELNLPQHIEVQTQWLD